MTHHSWKPYDLSNSKQDPRSGTWTSCRPSPRCSWRGTRSPPWSSRSGPWFSCKAVLWPSFRKAPSKIVHRASGRSTVSKRKHKLFDIEANFRNKTKTFWLGLLFIGTKAERFNLFQNGLELNRNVSAIFKV